MIRLFINNIFLSVFTPKFFWFLFFFLTLIGFAVFTGASVALGFHKLTIVLIFGIMGLLLLSLSVDSILKILIFVTFFVVGQLHYFAGINKAIWIPYLLSLLFFLKLLILFNESTYSKQRPSSSLNYLVYIFLLLIIASSIINFTPLLNFIAGGKNLFFVWSLFFLASFGLIKVNVILQLFDKIHYLVFLQIPLVFYQLLIIVPKRESSGVFGVSQDAIVGGFGGDPFSGGASGTLAFFMVVSIVYFVAKYRRGLLSLKAMVFFVILAFIPIAIAEVKVIVLLIPLALIILFWQKLIKNPLLLVVGTLSLVLVLYATLAGYQYQRTGDVQQAINPEEVLDKAFGYSFSSDYINYETREIGRAAAIVFWWNEQSLAEPHKMLFGHGLGSTRTRSSIANGELVAKYPFDLNRSSMTQLLWEVGLLGFVSLFLLFAYGAIYAYRISRDVALVSKNKVLFETVSVALFLSLVMLPYGRDVLEVPSLTLFIVLLLGAVSREHMRSKYG